MSTTQKELLYSAQSALLFVVFSSPMTYKLIRKVLGPVIASVEGFPHPTGIALHAILFGLTVFLLMKLNTKGK